MALETSSSNETLRRAAADAFTRWLDALTARLIDTGVPADRAPGLASTVLSLLEGAFVFAQTLRDPAPVRAAGAAAADLVRAALS